MPIGSKVELGLLRDGKAGDGDRWSYSKATRIRLIQSIFNGIEGAGNEQQRPGQRRRGEQCETGTPAARMA